VSRRLFTAALITALAGCSGGTTAAPASSSAPTTTTTATSIAAPTVEQMKPEQVEAALRRGTVTDARFGELGYSPKVPFETSTKPSLVVGTCGGAMKANDLVYGWSAARFSQGGSNLTTQVSHFELMTAAQAIEQVRALVTCPSYQQPDGLTLTMFPESTVPPVAGVDGQLSYCAEADGGIGFCHVLLAHQSFLSTTSLVARDRDTALSMLAALVPDLGAAVLTA
jgi:hypothetical protein